MIRLDLFSLIMMETLQYTSGLGSVKNCWSKTKKPRKLVKESRLGLSSPGISKVLPEATAKMRGEGDRLIPPIQGVLNAKSVMLVQF